MLSKNRTADRLKAWEGSLYDYEHRSEKRTSTLLSQSGEAFQVWGHELGEVQEADSVGSLVSAIRRSGLRTAAQISSYLPAGQNEERALSFLMVLFQGDGSQVLETDFPGS